MAKIVLADDSPGSRALLSAIVSSAGHEVAASCANGMEALLAADRVCPDIVMLDMLMPQMDGMEVLRHLRARPDGGPKVIMLSSVSSTEKIKAAWDAGAQHYLLKPYDMEKVKQTLERVLAGPKLAVG